MARGINKINLVGNLGTDPESRHFPDGGMVTTATLATNESWKDKQGQPQEHTEWHRLVFHGRRAEIAAEYLAKGSLLYVEGKNKTRKWTDSKGSDHYSTEIIVREFQMLGGKDSNKQGGNRGQQSHQQQPPAQQSPMAEPDFDFDDDTPFAPIGLQHPALLNAI